MVWSKISCVYDHILIFHQLAFNFAQAVVQLVPPFAWWMMRVKTLYVPPHTVSIDEFSPSSRITLNGSEQLTVLLQSETNLCFMRPFLVIRLRCAGSCANSRRRTVRSPSGLSSGDSRSTSQTTAAATFGSLA